MMLPFHGGTPALPSLPYVMPALYVYPDFDVYKIFTTTYLHTDTARGGITNDVGDSARGNSQYLSEFSLLLHPTFQRPVSSS